MATVSEYPASATDDDLIIGDPIDIQIEIDTDEDTSSWSWAADIRQFPGWPIIASFTIVPDTDPEVTNGWILHLDPADSALLRNGCGFSLKRTDTEAPVTWWIVTAMRMRKAYTGWPIESV